MLKVLIAWVTFRVPQAREIAQTDLEEAERQMLKHEAEALYHTKMTEYYQATFYRLSSYIGRSCHG